MRNLLRCRRGSAAFATVAALVPLIGFVALGAEAGSWYVTKQHAQNAADSAAMSGALAIANSDSQTYDYRGKEFGTLNGFSSNVAMTQGSYSTGSGFQAGGAPTNAVQAVVTQCQPQSLSSLVYTASCNGANGNVTIKAQAIALVSNPKQLCGLGLGRYSGSGSPTSALEYAGSETLSGNGCGFQSDNTVKYASAPSFSGTGWAVYASNGCVNSGTCDPGVPYNYYMPPAANPLQVLDTESFNSRTGNTSPLTAITCPTPVPVGTNKCYSVTPNSAGTGAYKDLSVSTGDYVTFAAGTYFFYNAAIKINGGTVNGTGVTLVLLGNSSLSITGATVNLSAPAINTTSSDLNGVLIDDQAPNKSSNAVTVNGSGTSPIKLGGAMYFPNVDVTWSGNSQNANTQCTEVIANSLKIGGGASYFSTQSCAAGTIDKTQVVVLVQ
jgi:Flp pilus assembly protein TadG